jgi:hypothetical protein
LTHGLCVTQLSDLLRFLQEMSIYTAVNILMFLRILEQFR